MKTIYFIISFFILFQSCRNSNKEFAAEFNNYNFNIFKNKSFLIRGNDNSGGTIIFISEINNTKDCSAPFSVVINDNNSSIKSTSLKMLKSYCNIDTVLLKKLAINFFSLGVSYLNVDSNSNVTIDINYNDESNPDLIKTNDINFFKKNNYNKWNKIKNNWYEATEE
ncbi:MAG: hypothetical protein KA275_04665 [Chitinophagaceae bacterium]|nr:hypothetical protein [Chitinophagaceae bacterium]